MICGGTGDVKDATPEVQEICNKVRADLEEKLGKKVDTFEAKKFKSQVQKS